MSAELHLLDQSEAMWSEFNATFSIGFGNGLAARGPAGLVIRRAAPSTRNPLQAKVRCHGSSCGPVPRATTRTVIPGQARIFKTTKTKNTSITTPWYNCISASSEISATSEIVKTSTDLYFIFNTDDILILVWQAFQLVMPPKYTEHYLCKQVSTCTYIYFQECR
jgi:hypothetical protein